MMKLWRAKNKTPDFMFEETVLQTKKQVRSRVRVSKVRTGAQKFLATLAVAGVAFTTVGASLMVPSQDEAANANVSQLTADLLCYRDTKGDEVDREDIADRFYHNGGNRLPLASASSLGAQMGGFNSLVGAKDAFTSSPTGDGVKRGVSLKTFTDQYGFWEPNFFPWYPAYNADGDGGDFIGTKGNANGSGVAPQSGTNASQLYTTNPADCVNFAGTFNASTANLVFMFPKMFIALATTMYMHATDMNMSDGGTLEPVGDAIEGLIVGTDSTKGLKDLLFLDFLAPIVMLGAIMLIWTGIVKRQSIAAAQGAMWMVGAAAGTLIFLTNPMIVPTGVDKVVSFAEDATSAALLQDTGVSREATATANNLSMCKAAGWESASREISCVVWYATIYTPWVSGQFGVPGEDLNRTDSSLYTGDNRGALKTWAARVTQGNSAHPLTRAGMAPNWANYQMHATSLAHPGEIENYSEIAYNRLVVNKDNASAAVWRDASSALPAAVLSAVAAAGPGAVLLSVSFLMLTYQLTMVILIIFAPVFLLMGITPGWGRRLTMRWLEMIVSLLLKRIMLILFLLVFVKVFSVVVSIPMMWILQVALVMALSWVALTQRERLTSFVTDSVNFGGSPRDLDFGGTVDGKSKAAVALVGGLAARQAFRGARGVAARNALRGGATAAAGAAAGAAVGGAAGGAAGGATTLGGAAARGQAANAIAGITTDAGNNNRVAPPDLGPTRDAGGNLPSARKDLAYAVADKEEAVKAGDTNYGTESAMGSEQARRNLEARLQEVSASPAERESMINLAGANGEIDASVQRRVEELTKQGKAPSGDVVKAIRKDQEEQWVGKKMEDARSKHASIEKRTQALNEQVHQLDEEFKATPANQRDKAFKDAYMKRKNELLNSRHELQQENRQVWSEIDNTMGVAAGKVSNNSAGAIPDRRMTEEAQQKAEARYKQAESNLETKQKKVKEADEAKELALKAGKAAAEKAYAATAAPVVEKVNQKVVQPVVKTVESGKRAVDGAKQWTGQQAHKLVGDLPPSPEPGKPIPHKPLPSGPLPPLPFPKPDNKGR